MNLRIPHPIAEEWSNSLKKAGNKEIGGVLFGEHVGESDFRIVHATKQTGGGGHSYFRRKGSAARREINRLSAEHGDNYERFNYLGEWHSHPNAPAIPSTKDELTMQRLLIDPDTNAHFLVLIIMQLIQDKTIEMSAIAYLRSGHIVHCNIELEEYGDSQ